MSAPRHALTVSAMSPEPATSAPPEPRPGWLAATRRAHEAYWADTISSLATPAALLVVRRYFDLIDERDRALSAVRRQRHTTGSTGQLVMHPSAGFLIQLEQAIGRLEAELGIGPAARSRLKLEAASTEDTLARLFARARQEESA